MATPEWDEEVSGYVCDKGLKKAVDCNFFLCHPCLDRHKTTLMPVVVSDEVQGDLAIDGAGSSNNIELERLRMLQQRNGQ